MGFSNKCAGVLQLRQFQKVSRLEDFSCTAERSIPKAKASSRVIERPFERSAPEVAKIQSLVNQAGNIHPYETAPLKQEKSEIWLLDEDNTTQASQNMSLEDIWTSDDRGSDPFSSLSDNWPSTLTETAEETGLRMEFGGFTIPTSDTAQKGKKILTKKPSTQTQAKTEEYETNVLGSLFPQVQLCQVAQDANENVQPIMPVQAAPFVSKKFANTTWSRQSTDSEDVLMRTVNPREVEGLAITDDSSTSEETIEMELPVVSVGSPTVVAVGSPDDFEFVFDQATIEEDAPAETSYEANNDFETPADSCDLFKMVLDETIQPDSEEFQNYVNEVGVVPGEYETLDLGDLIGPSTSSTEFKVKEEPHVQGVADHVTIVKRGRGRPRLPKPEVEPPRRPRGRPPTASTVAVLREDSSDKYRRMRDLNNAASKRCRLNRKRKMGDMEVEEEELKEKNMRLQIQVQQLEKTVEKVKSAVFMMVEKTKTKNAANVNQEPAPLPEFSFEDLLN